jgi:DNA-binding Lrp family transcriptional regulator
VNADLGAEEDLLKKLREIPNVKEVYVVYGVYDIVARVEADTMEHPHHDRGRSVAPVSLK